MDAFAHCTELPWPYLCCFNTWAHTHLHAAPQAAAFNCSVPSALPKLSLLLVSCSGQVGRGWCSDVCSLQPAAVGKYLRRLWGRVAFLACTYARQWQIKQTKAAEAHGIASSDLTDTMTVALKQWLRKRGMIWLICIAPALLPGASGGNCWEKISTKTHQAQFEAWRVQGYQILGGLGLLLLERSVQKGLTCWQRAQWAWGFLPKPPSLKGFIQA